MLLRTCSIVYTYLELTAELAITQSSRSFLEKDEIKWRSVIYFLVPAPAVLAGLAALPVGFAPGAAAVAAVGFAAASAFGAWVPAAGFAPAAVWVCLGAGVFLAASFPVMIVGRFREQLVDFENREGNTALETKCGCDKIVCPGLEQALMQLYRRELGGRQTEK
jgi:hypothetical protein